MTRRPDLARGFQLEQPPLIVPWGISEAEFVLLFPEGALRHVSDGYFTATCVSLGGTRHELGFHFHGCPGGGLCELEFFRLDAPLSQTYPDWQQRLESLLGEPDVTESGDEGYKRHAWQIGPVHVVHTVIDHFGPAEFVGMAYGARADRLSDAALPWADRDR